MASLAKRSLLLTFARFLNFIILFVSPIFLVRILDIHSFGQYQEFMVYATLASTFCTFSINTNLIYFVSKDPDNEKYYITNTVTLLFAFSVIGVAIIYLCRSYILTLTNYNFIFLMILYVLFFVNFNFIEFYWLAKKKSKYILYYSVTFVSIQLIVKLSAAYFSRNVRTIILSLVFLHALNIVFLIYYVLSNKLIDYRRINYWLFKRQLSYILPLGLANIIWYLNMNISKIIISNKLGAAALAIYAVGSKQIPIINIIRDSISSTIFPEITQMNEKNPLNGLELWKKANIIYIFFILPIFVIFFYYADFIIRFLFTDQYSQAIPLFRIYLLLMLLQGCFEVGSPLRAMNKNKYFIVANSISLIVNIILLYIFFNLLGFLGPAVAIVLTIFVLQIFLANKILHVYNISIKNLFMWKKVGTIFVVNLFCTCVLLFGEMISIPQLTKIILFSSLYIIVYINLIRHLEIDEINKIIDKFYRKFKLSRGLSFKNISQKDFF